MVIGSQFPTDKIVPAHFEAIKFGLQNDIAGTEHIIFYGDEAKATLITAKFGGRVVSVKECIRRRGR